MKDALELAPVNATIVLKNNVTLDGTIEIDKKINLDLNGCTINEKSSETEIRELIKNKYLVIVS